MRIPLRPTMLAGYPAAFWYMLFGMLMNGTTTFVLPFEAIYLVAVRHLPIAQASAIVGVYGIGACLSALVGGLLADKIGRRPTILIGLCCLTTTTFGLAVTTETWLIAALTFAMGFWTSWYRPACGAVVTDLVPLASQGRANGLIYWAYNVGMALSPLLASVMVQNVGYVMLFCLDGGGTALFCLLLFIGLPETRPAAAEAMRHHKHQSAPRAKSVWRDTPFLGFVLLSFALASMYFQSSSTLPTDMHLHGLDASRYGLAIAVNGIIVVLCGLPLSHWFSKPAPFRALAVSALLLGGGFGLTALADHLVSLPAYMGSIAIWTLGEIIFVPVWATVVAIFSPDAQRGTYQGIARMAWGLSACAGPLLGGLVLQRWSSSLWLGCAALGLLVACGFLLVGRLCMHHQRSEDHQPELMEDHPVTGLAESQQDGSGGSLERHGEAISEPSPEMEVYQAKCVEMSAGDGVVN